MLRYLYIFLFIGIAFAAKAQNATQNYTKEIIYTSGFNPTFPTRPVGAGSNYTTTTYYDGLGRPVQQVQQNLSPVDDKNIVTHIEYNKNIGQTKTYLPFTTTGKTVAGRTTYHSNFADNAQGQTVAYYNTTKYGNTTNPYSQELREASPRGRVLETAAPGADWAMDNPEKHTLRYQYAYNTANEVKQFSISSTWSASAGVYTSSIAEAGFYVASSLNKTVLKNENWKAADGNNNTTEEFKRTDGKVVLKRAYNNGAAHDTYYLYDFYGNLACVLPPLANGSIAGNNLSELCYQYRYDERNRLAEKKLPGKEWEYIVYDKADRMVMTGPVLSPFGDGARGWLYTKYDVMDRVVYTGYYNGHEPSQANRKAIKDIVYGQATANEVKTAGNGTIDGVTVRYSNNTFPTSSVHLLTVNYYDNYDYPNAPASFTAIEGATPVTGVKGLVTGNWVRVVTTPYERKASVSHTLYNARYQPLRNFTQNHLGGYTQTDSQLTFRGLPTKTITKHKRTAAASEITVTDTYTYDNRERLTQHIQQTGSSPEALIAQHTYDELGVLESKKVGGLATAANPLQTVDYKYNVRGWLTDINNLYARNSQLFSYRIKYNDIFTGDTSQPQYNGNISSIVWKTLVDNVAKGYGYDYDHLNRLIYASHLKESIRTIGNITFSRYNRDGQFAENLTYDKNGNIQTLKRYGKEEAGQPIDMDELSYTYQGNLLMSVTDATNSPDGFYDGNTTGNDYSYDTFGNLKTDKNKNITAIAYNHLNLPTMITFAGGTINYTYDAAGTRIMKTVTPAGGSTQTTDYLGGFQYLNNVLQFFPHPEGYVKHENNTYLYVYQYKDHLGNVRLSYADCNGDGRVTPTEIIEENNYYPFGLLHQGYNDIAGSCGNEQAQQYKYNGKELEQSFGLNIYEMDLRQYDPATGRWTVMDPIVHHEYSPYSAFDNNPVYWSDPSGADATTYMLNGNLVGATFTGQDAIDAFFHLTDGSPEKIFEAAVTKFYEFEDFDENNGNGGGGPKGKGGKYNGTDLSKVKAYRKETLFSFDLLYNTKMNHVETIELFQTVLAGRTNLFNEILNYIGYSGFVPGLDIKGLLQDLKNGNPSKIAVGLLIETFKNKVDKVSNSNLEILNNYLKIHQNDPKNMQGLYQIYEKSGSKVIPYGNLSVHYYDTYSGKYLGTVE